MAVRTRLDDEIEREVERRLRLLRSVERGSSISAACQRYGYTRTSYHRTLIAYEAEGKPGVRQVVRRSSVRSHSYDKQIINVTLRHQDWGRHKVAEHLRSKGVPVNPSSVRRAWIRHGIIEGEAH